MSDIFISYAQQDRNSAQKIATALESQGFTVWWDRVIPAGRIFDDVIEQALDSSDCVLVLWSKDSVISKWVKIEASEAANRNILLPVQIDTCKPSLRFRQYQSIDLITWQGDTSNPSFNKLLRDLNHYVKPNLNKKSVTRPNKKNLIVTETTKHYRKEIQTYTESLLIRNKLRYVMCFSLMFLLLSGIMYLVQNQKLQSFTIGNNIIDTAIKRSLKQKYFSKNDLGIVKTLDLRATRITDAGLQYLKPLSNLLLLDLSNTEITDAGLHYLKPLRNLQTLDLSDTDISNEASSRFVQARSDLVLVSMVVIE